MNKNKSSKHTKIALQRELVRSLTASQLSRIAGGNDTGVPTALTCPINNLCRDK